MGREEIAALIAILTAQNEGGSSSPVRGTWSIHFDKHGSVLDPGGPLFG